MPLTLTPYNPLYPQFFEGEAKRIKTILGQNCVIIHHIGSSAVPGLLGKPIIDILPVVTDLKAIGSSLFESLEYVESAPLKCPFHRYFSKKDVHLHILQEEDPHIQRFLMLRDYLRTHPEDIQRYADLKIQLSMQACYQTRFKNYTLQKYDFIQEMIEKSGFDDFVLAAPISEQEWQTYHRIKRTELFERSSYTYDENHPSMRNENCYHFILYKGATIVSVAMIEFLDEGKVALRSLATEGSFKNKGYGTYMMQLLERWLRDQRKTIVKMHAASEAEGFYRKLGYVTIDFSKDPSIQKNPVDLGKTL